MDIGSPMSSCGVSMKMTEESKSQCSGTSELLERLRANDDQSLDHLKHFIKERGGDINLPIEDMTTPLLIACEICRLDIVKFCVENGSDIFIEGPVGHAIHQASCSANVEIIKYLVNASKDHWRENTDINSKNKSGMTPLMLASSFGHLEVVKYLVKTERCNLRIKSKAVSDGDRSIGTALHQATLKGHELVVKYLIENDSGLVNMTDSNGITPVFWACALGELEIVKILVKNDAIVNIVNSSKASPIYYAALSAEQKIPGSSDVGRYLLRISWPKYVYNAAKRAPEGMFDILSGMELAKVGKEVLFETTILCPNEVSYTITEKKYDDMDRELNDREKKEVKERISFYFGPNGNSVIHFSMRLRYWQERFNFIFFQSLIPKSEPDRTSGSSEQSIFPKKAPYKPDGWRKVAWYPVRCEYVPVVNAQSQEFLLACIFISDAALRSPELFNNEVVQAIVDSTWVAHGYFYHMLNSFFFFALFTQVIITNYTFHEWRTSDIDSQVNASITMSWIMFISNTILVLSELAQAAYAIKMTFNLEIHTGRSDLAMLNSVLDIHNFLDWLLYSLIYVGIILRWMSQAETDQSAAVMAVVIILLVIKSLHFMRPYRRTGHFVRILYLSLYSTHQLLLVLLLVVFGFSQSLYLLSYSSLYNIDGSPDYFSNRFYSITHTFIFLYQPDLEEAHNSPNPVLATVVVCLFVFFATILILNLLIALLNAEFEYVKKSQIADLYRERARILIENHYMHSLWCWLCGKCRTKKRATVNGCQHYEPLSDDDRASEINTAKQTGIDRSSYTVDESGKADVNWNPEEYVYVLTRRVDRDRKLKERKMNAKQDRQTLYETSERLEEIEKTLKKLSEAWFGQLGKHRDLTAEIK